MSNEHDPDQWQVDQDDWARLTLREIVDTLHFDFLGDIAFNGSTQSLSDYLHFRGFPGKCEMYAFQDRARPDSECTHLFLTHGQEQLDAFGNDLAQAVAARGMPETAQVSSMQISMGTGEPSPNYRDRLDARLHALVAGMQLQDATPSAPRSPRPRF